MDEVKKEIQLADEQAKKMKENVQMSAASAGIKKIDNTFNELQAIQSTVKKFKPGDMVVPILSVMSLALLTIFVYIPMVNSGIKSQDETKLVNEKIAQLNKVSSDLDSLDVATLQTDLTNARAVIPFTLQVSDFLSYIDDAAKKKGLQFKDIVAGDITVRSNDETRGIDPVMRGVSGPVKYSGSLTEITSFLNEIQSASPFIISADMIKLRKAGSSEWELALTITGFYLNQASVPPVNIYSPFSSYSQYTDVLSKFQQKALLLGN